MKEMFIICPGARRTYLQMQAIYQRCNAVLITGTFIPKDSFLARYFFSKKYLIKIFSSKIIDLPSRNVCSLFIVGLLFFLAKKTKIKFIIKSMWYVRNKFFAVYAFLFILLHRLNNKNPFIVYGYSSGCGETSCCFSMLKKIFKENVILILEVTSATRKYEEDIFFKEKSKWNIKSIYLSMPKFLEKDEDVEFLYADKIVISSAFVREIILSQYPMVKEKLCYIRKPISFRFQETISTKKKVPKFKDFSILFVGTVSLLKGFMYLLEALDKIQGKKIILHVAGEISLPERLIQREYVNYHGFLNNEDLYLLYKKCHVMVHPSLAESSPNVIIEALYNSLPVVATKASGDSILSGFNGVVVPVGDSKGLSVVIERLFSSPKYLQNMQKNCASRGYIYSQEDYMQDFYKLMESI